jgi:hypothetical protein
VPLNIGGSEDGLLEALDILRALPLGTSDFSVAVSRLNNARRYVVANESGAARYELQLLVGTLKGNGDGESIRRHFRRQSASTALAFVSEGDTGDELFSQNLFSGTPWRVGTEFCEVQVFPPSLTAFSYKTQRPWCHIAHLAPRHV